MSRVVYAKRFFDLQLEFARVVSALSDVSYERAVFAFTNLFVRFGFGTQPDAAHPGWQGYVAGLRDADDPGTWTYRFYLERSRLDVSPPVIAQVGCFAYGALGRDRIRLHFQNTESEGHSPLSPARRDRRIAELRTLFEHVKRTTAAPVRVVGASWLYNLEAYRRVFPPAYVATARVLRDRYQRMPLWGQFLDRHGEVTERTAGPFLDRLHRQSEMDTLEGCFPFRVLGVEAPADDFYRFYGI